MLLLMAAQSAGGGHNQTDPAYKLIVTTWTLRRMLAHRPKPLLVSTQLNDRYQRRLLTLRMDVA